MVKLADFIKQNHKTIDKLTKCGVISTSLKNDFELHQHFKNSTHIKGKMDRYENTAVAMRVNSETVRKAVRKMEKNI